MNQKPEPAAQSLPTIAQVRDQTKREASELRNSDLTSIQREHRMVRGPRPFCDVVKILNVRASGEVRAETILGCFAKFFGLYPIDIRMDLSSRTKETLLALNSGTRVRLVGAGRWVEPDSDHLTDFFNVDQIDCFEVL
jgi:hypothetical protein